ncbi:MAG: 23S rRNA (pseudouridine(1915)-N(3))-methyltransferase RlmH [Rhodospirillales bacterium]|nr:23S rRNA (pseudouridine(1915)-N(3))-methyltransferase RlmH [Rhodospirillales bacterium]MCB9964923.1 23S rRNA (pseudouridine(1915)-N(3))-methyltransferase RlmH [Rhodospirillales bacterium]MCB9973717.1 23S rRNA (pseudouridine(1915)-N(3))-methyltransferase RlmH [Rhodospirillales bacterium]
MLSLDLITVGKLKKGPLFDLQEEYQKRIRWPLTLHQIESRYSDPQNMNDDENRKIIDHLSPNSFVIVLDERGDGLRSLDFAETIQKMQNNGEEHLQFVIGGADGLNETVRDRAGFLLSFGRQTWPHMMARIMLLEQIYRAQQILSGHPYHRE